MKLQDLLCRRDLAGTNLSGFSLGNCDLSGKNLRGADLSHAHLGRAKLCGTDLRNANLYKANLGAADLTGADLRYADLREANLSGALLDGADLRDTMGISGTQFGMLPYLVKHLQLEETKDYLAAKENGYLPLAHWGNIFELDPAGTRLQEEKVVWGDIKKKIGDLIFGDRQTFEEVRLVQKYQHYSQWAYMISQKGFERIANRMGLRLKLKS